MKKKTKLILLSVVFLMVLIGNTNITNAEVLKRVRGYYYPNSGMVVEFDVTEGDQVYWSFETYNNEFIVDVVLIREDGIRQSYVSQTEGSGIIGIWADESLALEFMNYDVYSGYLEIFVGLNEDKEQESVVITSVNQVDSLSININWEITGMVFFVNLDLYYGDVLVTELYNEVQCKFYSSITWSYYENEDVFTGDLFRIKITDFDDTNIYAYSDYFTIDVGSDTPDTPEIPSFNLLIIIGIIGNISAIFAIVIRKRIKKKNY